jgi:hypothetical protein
MSILTNPYLFKLGSGTRLLAQAVSVGGAEMSCPVTAAPVPDRFVLCGPCERKEGGNSAQTEYPESADPVDRVQIVSAMKSSKFYLFMNLHKSNGLIKDQ